MSTRRRIVAYTMHEHEHAAAKAQLSGSADAQVEPIVTDSMLIGYADQATVDDLKRQGVVVREVAVATPLPGAPLGRPAPLKAPLAPGAYVVVKLTEPMCDPHRDDLQRSGISVQERLGNRSYLARVDVAGAEAQLAALPFVESVTAYDIAVSMRRAAHDELESDSQPTPRPGFAAAVAKPLLTFDVLVHEPARRPEVEAELARLQIQVLGTGARKLRVRATEQEMEQVNGMDAVAFVDQFVQPKLFNDRVRGVILGALANPSPLTGAGEIVAVADSGLDATHPAFAAAVVGSVARGRPGDASDPHGHGTHVAGTVLGRGPQPGIAPGSGLFFQSVMDANGNLALPIDLGELFAEAYAAGARIHNDSWGADLEASYPSTSFEVDEFVDQHRDMLIVLAAGNAGSSLDPGAGARRAALGFVEWGSVGAPGTSKNALVVGASRSDRTDGPHAKFTFGAVWPGSFKDDPIAKELISGDAECLAAFSSRGPCNDRRIKPDVVAPGTDILSAKAVTAPSRNFTEVIKVQGAAHGYMNGTSMAAPAVAGLAALLREYLRTKRATPKPSAALLKALIINGTRPLSGPDAAADHPSVPNFHQGFGRVNLPSTVPFDHSFELAFVDNWQDPASQLHKTGMKRRFEFSTTQAGPLRITLAYTDVPGRGVQNEISLCLQMPDGSKRWGNENVPLSVFTPDPDNNVEVFKQAAAPAGKYLVIVLAKTLLRPPQDFALVVTGALASPNLMPT